jgi:hypothetical protein
MFYNNLYMLFAETDQFTDIQIVYPHFTCNMSHFFCLNYASGVDSRIVLEIIIFSKAVWPDMAPAKPRMEWVPWNSFRLGGGGWL